MSDSDGAQKEAQTKEYLDEMARNADAGETEGAIHIGTDADWADFVDGLMSLAGSDRDPLEHYCSSCRAEKQFKVIDTVRRPEFGVANLVIGCPDCKYTFINATTWVDEDDFDGEVR